MKKALFTVAAIAMAGLVFGQQNANPNNEVKQPQKGASLEQTFDLQGMAKGVYFVKVFTKSGQLVGERKILKK